MGLKQDVREMLTVFEKGSGQNLSPAKCSLLYHEGADETVVNEVKRVLDIKGMASMRDTWGFQCRQAETNACNFR